MIASLQKAKPYILAMATLLMCVLLLFVQQNVTDGVKKGFTLCGEILIPSLFPFLFLCGFLTLSGGAGVLCRFFPKRVYPVAVPILFCMLGGYPMGASLIVHWQMQGVLPGKTAKKLLLFVFCPSPSFVILGVGRGMFQSLQVGILLFVACGVSQIFMGLVGVFFVPKDIQKPPLNPANIGHHFVLSVKNTCQTMLALCGTVILFSVVSALPLPDGISCLFEVTNGIGFCVEKGCSLPVVSAILLFGGVCTHLQVATLVKGNMPSFVLYFVFRLAGALLSFGIMRLFCCWFPRILPTMQITKQVALSGSSLLPSVMLILTCVVFLASLKRGVFIEKQTLY